MTLGHTIDELQNKMSIQEVIMWQSYRYKYGPLNPVRKYDQGAAIVASQINRGNGGKAKPFDFMPYGGREPEKSTELTSINDFNKFTSGVKVGKRR